LSVTALFQFNKLQQLSLCFLEKAPENSLQELCVTILAIPFDHPKDQTRVFVAFAIENINQKTAVNIQLLQVRVNMLKVVHASFLF
jgi:hypothetical protein